MNHSGATQTVVISTQHPTLGALYWFYAPGSESNSADHYSVTDMPEQAQRLPHDWRTRDFLNWAHGQHLSKAFDSDAPGSDYDEVEVDPDSGLTERRLSGLLAELQARSGQTVEEFVTWLLKAEWFDTPESDLDATVHQ